MKRFLEKCKELGLEQNKIEELKATLPQIEEDKYILRSIVNTDYVSKTTMNETIQKRLESTIAKRNDIENKLAEASVKLKQYDGLDINHYKQLETQVAGYEKQTIEKAKSLVDSVKKLDNDSIKKRFELPAKEDEQNYEWANKFINKHNEYSEIGAFGKMGKTIDDKKGGGTPATKWKDPLDDMG